MLEMPFRATFGSPHPSDHGDTGIPSAPSDPERKSESPKLIQNVRSIPAIFNFGTFGNSGNLPYMLPRLAGGMIPFIRRYSTICPYSSAA
jgi:hypothetical protein